VHGFPLAPKAPLALKRNAQGGTTDKGVLAYGLASLRRSTPSEAPLAWEESARGPWTKGLGGTTETKQPGRDWTKVSPDFYELSGGLDDSRRTRSSCSIVYGFARDAMKPRWTYSAIEASSE